MPPAAGPESAPAQAVSSTATTVSTAAGLLLSGGGSRLAALSERHLSSLRRWTRYGTVLTALAVLTVGISLVLRSLLTL